MWTITLRDLQFRRRQFAIAVVGAGLAFGLALVMTGMSSGFRHEARATVGGIGADAWVVRKGVTGPFTSDSVMPAALAGRIGGVTQAEPLVTFGHVARIPGRENANVTVIGHSIGGLGDPVWGRGDAPPARGRAIVDERLDVKRGETFTIGGHTLRVERVVGDRTTFAGVPVVFTSLREAQDIAYEGRPLATTIVVRGTPRAVPPGFVALPSADVRDDLVRSLDGAVGSIDLVRVLMWILAVVIIAAVTYLSALERLRDFAVLKAVGGSSRSLMLGLSLQAVLASLLAALLGALVAQGLGPSFPLPVVIESSAYVALPVTAVVIGVLASLVAMRRAMKVDPALAFSG